MISIVIPVYNEADNIPKLTERLSRVMEKLNQPWEVVFTNDGSKDNSFELLHNFYLAYPENVRIINFNGNFGQHMAIMSAFEKTRGDVVITLDADLQNPPEEIPNLIDKINQGHDVVGTYRKARKDSIFRKWASKVNNKIRETITGIHMQDQGCMLRAYTKNIVDLIVSSKEVSTFIPALACSYATNAIEIEVEHDARLAGESKYKLYDLIRLNFDLMTGFSLVPLQIVTMLGMLVSFGSGILVVYLLLRRIIMGPEVQGLFTLAAIEFFLVGLALLSLGVMGEYVGRIYQEVRSRPRFVIKEVVEKDHAA